MVQIIISTEGFDRVFDFVSRLESTAWQQELLDVLGLTVTAQTVQHFQDQGGPDGAWAPTLRGGQILVLTGQLRGSIGHTTLSDTEVSVGTNVLYGKFHQEGTNKMPRRAFLGITDSDQAEVADVIERYIDGLLS